MAERLTPKERKVLAAMAEGLHLRRKDFSPSYEIATRTSDPLGGRSSALFPVLYAMVERLKARDLISARHSYRYLITDKGREALNPTAQVAEGVEGCR